MGLVEAKQAIAEGVQRGVPFRRIGDLAVALDPRCDICSVIGPSSGEDLGAAVRLSPYPPVDSLDRDFMPSAHMRMVHGGGAVALELAKIADITRATTPVAQ